MQIANPIYDSVFKYLMEDNKIAKLYISKIIDEEIAELVFCPQEFSQKMEQFPITVYRLDFKAKIKLPSGELKTVIIEIQKAKLPTDIMRFRKYLSEQYSNSENSFTIKKNPNTSIETEIVKAIPIISIYFLGHKLEHIDSPIIKVNRTYIDVSTKKEIKEKEEFIESLTHDSYIIQIPELKGKRRNDLESILSVFDQSNQENNYHILNIKEEEVPAKYRYILRHLQKAILSPEMKKKMDIEDDYVGFIESKLREIQRRDIVIEENKRALDEKDRALDEKDKELDENKKALDNAKSELLNKEKFAKIEIAKNLLDVLDIETISAKTGLSVDEIEKLK